MRVGSDVYRVWEGISVAAFGVQLHTVVSMASSRRANGYHRGGSGRT